MSQFFSTISVIAVEAEERTSARTGNKFNHFAARCVLLDDAGKATTIGTIRSRQMTPECREKLAVGTFRLGYAVIVPDFGDNKGDLMPMITSVIPVTTGKHQPADSAKG